MEIAGKAFVMPVIKRPDLVMVRGEGSYLWDDQGRRYLDFVQGWAVNCLGHCPPVVVRAIQEQAALLLLPSQTFYNAPYLKLAEVLAKKTQMDHVFFTNCGAEANEGAIKLVRKWGAKHRGGAYEFITLEGAFHGRTLATMSASGKPGWEGLFDPKVPGFIKVPPNNLQALKAAVSDRTVAVMLEPIQGEAGVIPIADEILRAIRQFTNERGILLIVDEVQTGVGRTGKFLASDRAGISPDILTLGKGLGGGVPIGAMLCRKEISCFDPGDQGGTFNGNPLVCAAALAVVTEVLGAGFLERTVARGNSLRQRFERLGEARNFGGVRGCGLLLALDLKRDLGPQIVERARAEGLLINSPRPNLLRLMPALTVSESEIDEAMQILDRAAAAVLGENAAS